MGKQKTKIGKAYPIRISLNALENFDEITGYIAFINHQPKNAIKVGDRILATIERIEQSPFAYYECQELQTKTKIYRRAICLSWQIIYKITSSEIIVLGILHTSRKPTSIKALRKIK